jgi:glycosyltransferase involved in cell wall biosynthesis
MITVGVPVYRGELYLAESLRSLQAQTFREFNVLISLDGPQPESESVCRPFLEDPRFRLTQRPERLGWVGNINWLMDQVQTPYWVYQQQDDILDPGYLQALVDEAVARPGAAIVYCDMRAFGALESTFVQESVLGNALERQLTLLREHHPAGCFRGLTRVEALREAGGVRTNDVDNFSCDTTWMASIARWGELRRLPALLYHKRYHGANEHGKWAAWPPEKRARGWVTHCVDMLEEALKIGADPAGAREIWQAALRRLVMRRVPYAYLDTAALSSSDRASLLEGFLTLARERGLEPPPDAERTFASLLENNFAYRQLRRLWCRLRRG